MIDFKRFFKSIGLLNSADQTKALEQTVSNSATTSTKLTLTAKQNKDTNLDYPNIPVGETTDELVSTKSEQTLTNKTLDQAIITNSDITDSTFDDGTITDSTIDNSPIGSTTPSTAEFTTVEATAMTVNGDTVTTNTATQTLSNKSLVDNSTFVIDNSDATKRIGFDSAGSTATTTTIKSNQSLDIVLDLPDTTDVLVARNTTDILTNKTLTSPTINTPTISNGSMSGTTITSGSINDTPIGNTTPSTGVFTDLTSTGTFSTTGNLTLGGDLIVQGDLTVNGTTTTLNTQTLDVEDTNITVNVGGNDAASEGAGLTVDRTGVEGSLIYKNSSATRFAAGDLGSETDLVGTTTTQTLTNKNLSDTTVVFVDVADATKQIKIDAAGTTGTATTILSSQTTNKTITLPDATDTLVGKSTTDLLNNKQLVDTTTAIVDNVDNTRQIKFDAGGTTGTSSTITGAQTANRVLTLPDATTTLVGTDTTQTLTNKTISGNTATNLISGAGTLTLNTTGTITVPSTTDTLVGKATTDTLTNKTIQFVQEVSATDTTTTGATQTLAVPTTGITRLTNVALTSLAGIVAGASGQNYTIENKTGATVSILNEDTGATAANRIQTGTAAAISLANNASLLLKYDTTSARWQVIGGTGSGSGSGSGGVNFITAGDAETTNPFVGYQYLGSTTRPVASTATLQTAPLAATITATAPLAGSNSFLIGKTGVNQQAIALDIPFTVSPAYRAQSSTIEFDYMLVSGTFQLGTSTQDSELIVYIIDVDNNVSIEPSNFKFLSNSTTISSKFSAQFQTSSNSTNYRLSFFSPTTNANAFSMKIDNIKVGPSSYVYGTPVTDWLAYTPTLTGVPGGASEGFFWKRVGDSIQIKGTFTTGTPDGNPFSFTMPAGLSADSTKQGTNPTSNAVGHIYSLRGTANESFATTTGGPFVAFTDTATNANLVYVSQDTTSSLFTKDAGNEVFISTTKGVVEGVIVPILGWSSSVQMSDNASTRVVAMQATQAGAQSIPNITETTIVWGTKTFDTHGTYSTSTGLFTCPVAGKYRVSAVLELAANSTGSRHMSVRKNGVIYTILSRADSVAAVLYWLSGSALVDCNAGDTIGVSLYQSSGGALNVNANGGTLANFSVQLLQGPSAIAASELVAARYTVSTGASTANTSPINFDTKEFDTHNAVTTGVGTWTFTAPAAGTYLVSTSLYGGATAVIGKVFKNGTLHSIISNSTASVAVGLGSTNIRLNAGDTLQLRPHTTMTPSVSPDSSTVPVTNHISITRIGQ